MHPTLDVAPLFEGFEPIETDRLILRAVRTSDAPAMFEIMRDPRVIEYFGTPPMVDLREAIDRCERLSNRFSEGQSFRLALELKDSGKFIGTGGFWRFIPEHFRAEIGYELSPLCWGRGLMVEALESILVRGFGVGMNSVEANIHPQNRASQRVLEKLGFRLEGVTRSSFYEPYLGEFSDNAIYGLTRMDWQNR